MLVVNEKVAFTHVPKTAGMWLRKVLEDVAVPHRLHASVDEIPKGVDIVAFIRNPLDWYVSYYEFFRQPFTTAVMLSAIGRDSSFDHVLQNLLHMTPETLEKASRFLFQHGDNIWDVNIAQLEQMNPADSYYSNLIRPYIRLANNVVRVENIKTELSEIFQQYDIVVPNGRLDTPRVNNTERLPTASYYNDGRLAEVYMKDGWIIDKWYT